MGKSIQYEKNTNVAHHDHLICTNCGKLIEIVDSQIEELQQQIAEAHGFTLTHHRLELYGFCSDCSKGGDNQLNN